MTTAGDVLRNFLRARGVTLDDLSERTRAQGRGYSAAYLGKAIRGERRLTDALLEAIMTALELTAEERHQVDMARAGVAAVDMPEQLLAIQAQIAAGIERLSGEIRGQINQVNDRLDRLRDQIRP